MFLGQNFEKKELIAGLVAIVGVVLIAQPESIFGELEDFVDRGTSGKIDHVDPVQRSLAVVASILGVFGASGAYTTIRVIGNRAHALISVNYFAALGTAGSACALILIPGIGFTPPQHLSDWVLLLSLGVLGFILQFLLTAGLQLDKSSKATSMLYAQVLFALAFDWIIWNVLPNWWSIFGGFVVIASTLWSALHNSPDANVATRVSAVDEESALLITQEEDI